MCVPRKHPSKCPVSGCTAQADVQSAGSFPEGGLQLHIPYRASLLQDRNDACAQTAYLKSFKLHTQARRREMMRHERMEQEAKEQELDTEYEVNTLDLSFQLTTWPLLSTRLVQRIVGF